MLMWLCTASCLCTVRYLRSMVVFIILMFVVQNVRGSAVMFLLLDGNDFTLMDYNGKMSKKKKLIVQVLCLLVYNNKYKIMESKYYMYKLFWRSYDIWYVRSFEVSELEEEMHEGKISTSRRKYKLNCT